jgi:hypothetical protein
MKPRKTILAASIVAFGLSGYPVLSLACDSDHSKRSGHHCRQSAHANETYGWGVCLIV